MKKAILLLAVIVACSGQMCGTSAGFKAGIGDGALDTGGERNICERSYFESTYRIGIDLPAGVGLPQSGDTNSSVARKLTWDWNGTNPATKFILVVSRPVSVTSIDKVGQDSVASFKQSGFTVMQHFKFKLDDGADAYYLGLSPNDKDNTNVEVVMTISQRRLITLSATYITTGTTAGQTDAIGAALRSLCADVN